MGLTPAQMARMSRLLDEALELDEAARGRWLEELAPEFADLLPALRAALLKDSGLATIPKVESELLPPPIISGLQAGHRVGPYELIRRLGSGGMAEVWLARRADGAFKREVALKLPMLMHWRRDLQERFTRERDILATLEHPNIARLYDAGTDPQGLPYLSMEYVQGQTLTVWCDAQALDVEAKLTLFLQVLRAVQYAHERQVIHRDLKPSNILVSQAGEVRLLDFGVAKLLLEANDSQLTGIYGRALTPDYASPELLRGDPVDARSDVYSLGVVLYELLTGARPYHLKSGAALGALERAVATSEIKRPSALLLEQKSARQMRGDLDAIVMMALSKDANERYATAEAMAEDLLRYLSDQPVQAQHPRLVDRVRKFLIRQRTAVSLSAAFIVLLATTITYELRRAALDQANSVLVQAPANPLGDKSIAVLPFTDISEKKDKEYLVDGLSDELIDHLAQVSDLQVIARTSSSYFKGKPATVAQIARTLGVANILQGSVRTLGSAIQVHAQLIRGDTGVQLWSQAFNGDVSDVASVQDHIASAIVSALTPKLLPAVQIKDPLRSDQAGAYTQYLLSNTLGRIGTLEGYRGAILADHEAIRLDKGYAAAYGNLSDHEIKFAEYSDDAAGYERARVAAETAIALAPDQWFGYAYRAAVRRHLLDFVGAKSDLEHALALAPNESTVQSRYGNILAVFGDLPNAKRALRKAIELDSLNYAPWFNLSLYLMAEGDYAASRLSLERAYAIAPNAWFMAAALAQLDLIEGKAGDALTKYQNSSGSDVLRLQGIALAQHSLGEDQLSRAALEQLIALHAGHSAYQIASVYAWRGDHDKAFDWLQRAYQGRDSDLDFIQNDPQLSGLRADPRYHALLVQMKLTP